MYRIVFLLLSSVLFLSCNQKKNDAIKLPYYNEPTFTPIFKKENVDLKKQIPHTIGDFSFLNQDSILINQKNIEGKIHIANFIFTSCGSICPTMTRNLKIVNDSLIDSKNLVFLSYSVTPWIDSPTKLKKYKQDNEIKNPNWHFLTGTKGAIYQLARQSYFAEEDIGFSKDSTEFLHTEHFILVDKTKRIRGIYNGTLTLEMQQLIDDIKTLQIEK
ncbi:SCO family protein [Flavobacterium nackdongense]|uniref:SCO family protein n=1 Tax=Flavobacterium nackdongense TaxID=2547394 RepID=A0A4P6YB55_9FLAO|nr:SCO family protein [Flavobacterium nackdongense]QBN20391.1 SCO family protein [Flavobacterium nackdongense]